MNTFLDDSLVGVLLLVSAGYAFSALGPRNLRRRMLSALSAGLTRLPTALGVRRAAQRLARAADTKPQGACGGCDSCASVPPARSAAPEIKVPIASIGRVQR